MPIDGSTVLTFLRNSTGGFGTSVASTAYTTFRWDYSLNSLSITTESQVDSENTTSGSTLVVLTHGGSPDLPWLINQFGANRPIYGVPVVHVNSDVLWTSGIGNLQQPATFTRNLTNNP